MHVKQHTRRAAVVVMTAAAVLGLATMAASAVAGTPSAPPSPES